MCADQLSEDATIWVPICCQTVMRRNFYRSEDNSIAATLVCASCGKHVTLQPHTSGPIESYGEGARILRLVSVSRTARRDVGSAVSPDPDATM